MRRVTRISRWGFLKALFSAGALILRARVSSGKAPDGTAGEEKWYPSVYLGIEPTGTVIIVAHRSEMGTGKRIRRLPINNTKSV